MRRKLLVAFGFGFIFVLLLAGFWFRPDRVVMIATAAVARNICSAAFIAGRAPEDVFRSELLPEPGMALLAPALTFAVDRKERRAFASFMGGLVYREAVFTPGRGCRLKLAGDKPLPPEPLTAPITRDDSEPPEPVAPANPALAAALDRAFENPNDGSLRQTRAVVVLHEGRIIAERYRNGWTAKTPILGHSLSKSVTHALLGILVKEGRLDPDGPAGVPEWQGEVDERKAITVRHLMTMTAGFPPDEGTSGFDRASRMWFIESDEAAFAAQERPRADPGTAWAYHNGSVMLLSRIVRDLAGGDGQAFARRALFEPLGMSSAIIEADGANTPIGASQVWATARDWARFGQLYLDGGVVAGRRILPEGWTEDAATPSPFASGGYGALFWTNRGDSEGARRRRREGMPADSFAARGYLGQWIVIVPSKRLVVARFGNEDYLDQSTARLVGDIVAALTAS